MTNGAISTYGWPVAIAATDLPARLRRYIPTFACMDRTPDSERRARLAFAIRQAMNGHTAQQIAERMDPPRSRETVARWARGNTVPSALDVAPLAHALGVRFGGPPEGRG